MAQSCQHWHNESMDEFLVLLKPVVWLASSHKDLKAMPDGVQDEVGFALHQVQQGATPDNAKPLTGSEFRGASVLEIVADERTDTYRAVYTVRFAGTVFVLHCFQKKSKRGIATPKSDIDLIKNRLRQAQIYYEEWQQETQQEQL